MEFTGSQFDTWNGCYAIERVALLACVALNGYHSGAIYSWEWDDGIVQNSTPLLYSTAVGIYTCTVTHEQFLAKCQFKVEGKILQK